jgi:hypothetical protein
MPNRKLLRLDVADSEHFFPNKPIPSPLTGSIVYGLDKGYRSACVMLIPKPGYPDDDDRNQRPPGDQERSQ